MQETFKPNIPVKPDLVIFDLDGTLYDTPKLRKLLMRKLLFRLFSFRFHLKDFVIIKTFREEREKKKGYSSGRLNDEQFEWCASRMNLPVNRVRKCIEDYMYHFPLPFLKRLKYKGIDEFFTLLRKKQIKIAIFSDYPVEEKLQVLGLSSDAMYFSTQPFIGQLKPNPKALQFICSDMKTKPENTLYIGDREDTDGEGARKAGISFICVDRKKAAKGTFYSDLYKQLQTYHD